MGSRTATPINLDLKRVLEGRMNFLEYQVAVLEALTINTYVLGIEYAADVLLKPIQENGKELAKCYFFGIYHRYLDPLFYSKRIVRFDPDFKIASPMVLHIPAGSAILYARGIGATVSASVNLLAPLDQEQKDAFTEAFDKARTITHIEDMRRQGI